MIERRSSPGLARPQLLRDPREALLALVELLQLLRRDLRRGHLGGEPLQLGAHHERLVQLLPRDRPDADAAVRHERDEPERRQPPQRLPHRRPRDVELLGELLLPEDGARGELPGDDRLLDHERDVVCLGAVEAHSRRVYAGSVRNSTSSGASASCVNSSFASSPASTAADLAAARAPRRTGRSAPTATPASARSRPWRRPPSDCRSRPRRRRAARRRGSGRRRTRSCAGPPP